MPPPVVDGLVFRDKDLNCVSHNDPLILTIELEGFKVRRALVDSGSSVDIRYNDFFKLLGKKNEDLILVKMQLTRVGGYLTFPLGMYNTHVSLAKKVMTVEFLIVDMPAPYNLFLGRP